MNIILGTAQFGLDYGVSNYTGQVHLNEVKNISSAYEKKNYDEIRQYHMRLRWDVSRDFFNCWLHPGACPGQ